MLPTSHWNIAHIPAGIAGVSGRVSGIMTFKNISAAPTASIQMICKKIPRARLRKIVFYNIFHIVIISGNAFIIAETMAGILRIFCTLFPAMVPFALWKSFVDAYHELMLL